MAEGSPSGSEPPQADAAADGGGLPQAVWVPGLIAIVGLLLLVFGRPFG